MKVTTTCQSNGPIALNRWLRSIGRTAITGWRWRKCGWIDTINIAGRVYITPEAIDRFTKRAEAGEFSKEHKAPLRKADNSLN